MNTDMLTGFNIKKDRYSDFLTIISDIKENRKRDLINYTIICVDEANKSLLLRECEESEVYSIDKSAEGIINVSNVKAMVNNVFKPLSYLYDKGEFHGCLCPSNILIRKEDSSVILKNYCLYMIEDNEYIRYEIMKEDDSEKKKDAKKRKGKKKDEALSVEFLCPEIRKGEKLSRKSDVWCFGKLINYLLGKCKEGKKEKKFLEALSNKCIKEDVSERMNVETLGRCLNNEESYKYIVFDDSESVINELKDNKTTFEKLIDDYLRKELVEMDFFFLILGVLISLSDDKIEEYKKKFLESEWFKWLGGIIEDSTNYYILLKSVKHAQLNCFIRNYPFSKFGASEMAKYSKYLVNLEMFKCRDNEIGDEGLVNLCKCFPNTKKLMCLDISNNGIGDIGINELVSNFNYIQNIKTLMIDGCKIRSATLRNLCNGLSTLKKLEILSLSDIKLEKEDIKKLNASLEKLNSLGSLSMIRCGLKDDVVELNPSLSKMVKTDKKDTPRVDLDYNEIGDAGFLALYQHLTKHNEEINICLNYNNITQKVLRKIKTYREKFRGKLYLLCNNFTYEEFREVKEIREFVDVETSFK